jgi:hypothetical protein
LLGMYGLIALVIYWVASHQSRKRDIKCGNQKAADDQNWPPFREPRQERHNSLCPIRFRLRLGMRFVKLTLGCVS